MKFLHLSDLHLGKRVHAFSMLEDQRVILEQIAQMARAQCVDAVVIAGDIYDKSIPPGEAVGLFDSFFTSLCAAGISVLAISGNHDSGERLNFGQTLLARQGVYLAGTFGETMESVELCDADGCRVQFHLLPWLRPMSCASGCGWRRAHSNTRYRRRWRQQIGMTVHGMYCLRMRLSRQAVRCRSSRNRKSSRLAGWMQSMRRCLTALIM